MTRELLRVGVIGAGAMGLDHVRRVASAIDGARVAAVVDPDPGRRAAALAAAPEAVGFAALDDALAAGAMDAVLLATPGPLHEEGVLACLAAGLPTLCEKPLTPEPEAGRRVVDAELAVGRRLIQVGFMRRFDPEYVALRAAIARRDVGELLMIHAAHRNPSVPAGYTESMLITDSVVHELDVVPWLAGAEIASIEVRRGRRNPNAPGHLREPILVLLELDNGVLVDVEMSVSVRFGYQVITEAVCADGVIRIDDYSAADDPAAAGPTADGIVVAAHADYTTRFADAYDREVQAWVDAARAGGVTGPSSWDGYRVAVRCAAGLAALAAPGAVRIDPEPPPVLYT